MKIIDTTTYFEEKLMMNLRFNILNSYVDNFIVCEARFTHSGKSKDINFKKKDYPEFEHKITHLIIDKEPIDIIKKDNLNSYDLRFNSIARIRSQRNYLMKALKDYSTEDYIIYSDNDEIPNLEFFDFNKNKNKIILFKQELFYYKFNLLLPKVDWYGSKACKIKNLKTIDILRSVKNKKYNIFRIDTLLSNIKYQSVNIVNNGGWHFSNLKNIEELERKYLNDENHAEYEVLGHSIEKIKNNLKNKTIDYDHSAKKNSSTRFNSTKLETIDISKLPSFIQINKNNYLDWLDI
jgi:beta-1,4-mannosyl-glycoprotein beta-1,4-N-acetylglucosaminyltransferase|tara:strand:+ start:419 stop:1297 length:879 start_codon:yes stop_codon:yes gene_type:complete